MSNHGDPELVLIRFRGQKLLVELITSVRIHANKFNVPICEHVGADPDQIPSLRHVLVCSPVSAV